MPKKIIKKERVEPNDLPDKYYRVLLRSRLPIISESTKKPLNDFLNLLKKEDAEYLNSLVR